MSHVDLQRSKALPAAGSLRNFVVPADRSDLIGFRCAASPRRSAEAVAVGGPHTCALLDSGDVKCWGNNLSGELGLGNTLNRGDTLDEMGAALPAVSLGAGRTVTALAGGESHTCAVLDDGRVKCWGDNLFGQLGLGDTLDRGDTLDEMGDALPALDLGAGRTATAIAAGTTHSCAILDDGSVKCWGGNDSGQLGQGHTRNLGDDPGEVGDLAAVELGAGRTARAIAAGYRHACAVLDDNSVRCWGDNEFGQLGLGDTQDRGDAAGEMGDDLPALALGAGRTAVAIGAGLRHTCALLDNASIKCWGDNNFGQLGMGDARIRGDEPGEMGDDLQPVDL